MVGVVMDSVDTPVFVLLPTRVVVARVAGPLDVVGSVAEADVCRVDELGGLVTVASLTRELGDGVQGVPTGPWVWAGWESRFDEGLTRAMFGTPEFPSSPPAGLDDAGVTGWFVQMLASGVVSDVAYHNVFHPLAPHWTVVGRGAGGSAGLMPVVAMTWEHPAVTAALVALYDTAISAHTDQPQHQHQPQHQPQSSSS